MKKVFVGTCKNILDTKCLDHIMSDATDMSQIVENSQELKLETFIQSVEIPQSLWIKIIKNKNRFTYLFNSKTNLYILYDDENDIHYFFY